MLYNCKLKSNFGAEGVPENLANGVDLRTACPKGATAFILESNETLTCNPRARMLQCPDDYYCHDIEQAHDFGVCCPIGGNLLQL